MAGVDAAGLVLGAIPILVGTIKAYREAHDKFQTFKQSTKQLHMVDAHFRVCRLIFLNECRFLFDIILSDQALSKQMVEGADCQLWRDNRVRLQLEDVLKDHVDACTAIVADSHLIIQQLNTRLFKLQISPVGRCRIISWDVNTDLISRDQIAL
jgi:hypothetical protein